MNITPAPAFHRADGLTYIVAESGQIYELRPVNLTIGQIRQAVAAGLLTPAPGSRQILLGHPASLGQRSAPEHPRRAIRRLNLVP